MKYLFLIYANERSQAGMTEADMGALIGEYNAYTQSLKDREVYISGEALQPTQTATTVRVRDGKLVRTDGPFAETKEQLGGFYMVDCKDLDEALALAAKIPDAKHGSIEVRPVMSFD